MRTEEEIAKKAAFCFTEFYATSREEKELPTANHYLGAWFALLWVLEEEDEI